MRPYLVSSLLAHAAVAAACGGGTTDPAPRPPAEMAEPAADVIVVGGGIAGLSAALEAADAGARVTVVDMSSVFGGHAIVSEGGLSIIDTPLQRDAGIADSPDLAAGDFHRWGHDPDPVWVDYYVNNSRRDIYDWITAMGVEFERVSMPAGNSVARFHHVRGRGVELVSAIYRECLERPNIRFLPNFEVTGLIAGASAVVGVRGRLVRTGERRRIVARAVVLATGGFQSNLDLVREFFPRDLPFPDRVLAGSGLNSVGSGLELARSVGAAIERTDHQWNYAKGLPDPRYPGMNRGLHAVQPAAIWVNAKGKRFVNERASDRETVPALLAERPATYWLIFDEQNKTRFRIHGAGWETFERVEKVIFADPDLVKSATSVAALGRAANLPETALVDTVNRYNRMIAAGEDTDFGRFDGTSRRIPPAIEKPPFYAVQMFLLTRKSMGGIAIDGSCQVRDPSGRPIRGLYAAGEVTGFAGINGKAGLEGTFLGPSIVTGRIAARTAIGTLGRRKPIRPVVLPRRTGSSDPADHIGCTRCHDVRALSGERRAGYHHFERVHALVVDRGDSCARCHAALAPYDPAAHRSDPLAELDNCKFCHVAGGE